MGVLSNPNLRDRKLLRQRSIQCPSKEPHIFVTLAPTAKVIRRSLRATYSSFDEASKGDFFSDGIKGRVFN